MDQPGLDVATHYHALAALGKTNKICRISRILWQSIRGTGILSKRQEPLRILDVASGGGDNLIGLVRQAAHDSVAVEAMGCDINPNAIRYAQKTADRSGLSCVGFFQLNALEDPFPENYDVIMCTLFLHHLKEADIRNVLARMAKATRKLVLVDDLRRNRLGYLYAWVGARLLTRSHIVHIDGPLSVRAAFTLAEFDQLARDAGLSEARFRRHWPQRFVMTWMKS